MSNQTFIGESCFSVEVPIFMMLAREVAIVATAFCTRVITIKPKPAATNAHHFIFGT